MSAAAIETGESPGRRALRRFAQHKLAMFGLVVVIIFVAAAALLDASLRYG